MTMGIPLLYNLRHLRSRPGAAAMAALGVALPTTTLVLAIALPEGLNRVLQTSGHPLNLVVLRKGAQSETQSGIDRETIRRVETLPGLDKGADGRPLFSPEAFVLVNVPRRTGLAANLILRGTGERGWRLRPSVRLVEGRWFTPGLPELTVSKRVASRFANLGLGESIRLGRSEWRVVGLFDAGGKANDSEAWGDADLLMADFRREDYSAALLRAESSAARDALVRTLDEDKRLSLRGIPEPDYYFEQTKSPGLPIQFIGMFVSVLLAIGASVGAMNTMYAAVASRTREIAVLRAIGFRRRAILASFLLEAFALAVVGGLLGCALAFPFNGLATSTTNWQTFSDIVFQFRITPRLLLYGMTFSAGIGLVGGVLPARLAASRSIASSMRAL